MLVSHRSLRAPRLGVTIEKHSAAHARFRLECVHNTRVVSEDDLSLRALRRRGRLSRPGASVILAGRARITVDGVARWLEAGDVCLIPAKGAVVMRIEGDEYRSLFLEWDPGSLGGSLGSSIARLDAASLDRLRAVASAMTTADADAAARAVVEIANVLRASGIALDRHDARDLVESIPEPTLALSRALDDVLSDLENGPAMVDLETRLGLSARHVQRRVAELNERYGFNAQGFRDALVVRRLTVGPALMTVRGATTEAVARILGYASPATFCRALAHANLPSPGRIAEEVAALV
jgi:hypothetical protein